MLALLFIASNRHASFGERRRYDYLLKRKLKLITRLCMNSIKQFFIKNKLYFAVILIIYIIGVISLQIFTNLTLNDSIFWLGLTGLLISFFTSIHSRASLTKIFRFADFRTHGVDKHAQEVAEGKYSSLMEKDSDKFFIPFSTINFLFGILAFIICILLYVL